MISEKILAKVLVIITIDSFIFLSFLPYESIGVHIWVIITIVSSNLASVLIINNIWVEKSERKND